MSDPKLFPRDLATGPESLEDAYSAEYLRDCANGAAREERLAELKRRIELGAYNVDPGWVADHFLVRQQSEDE